MNTYKLELLSLERELPLMKIKDDLAIASFVILGDTELVQAVAPAIADRLKEIKDIDIIVTAEAKGIPLAYEISKLLGLKEFIVARKSIKAYMDSPITEEVNSITTQKKQFLCLDKIDAEKIKGKNIAIIDDVISTGESLKVVEKLVEKAGGIIKAKAAILAEGDASNRDDIIFIKRLPLFKVDENENFIEI
ncbi:adenine phosphoribosyltransferase [Clostridium sp. MSJ-11]|uniref:Adenine phosphoribosyltransferase n=1 Tax=Clostridium mobile TaxID=2841512 RepID=A0ABS6EGX5_9CLOT|nr:phosphoribosyltransferase family protein [Clostridium mobile]MBU5484472.1 adenine phosphoribosyltransferase [Clostridium mobile]